MATIAYWRQGECKPCPFCGCSKIDVIFESDKRVYIVCPDCGVNMHAVSKFGVSGERLVNMLVKKWNTRKEGE